MTIITIKRANVLYFLEVFKTLVIRAISDLNKSRSYYKTVQELYKLPPSLSRNVGLSRSNIRSKVYENTHGGRQEQPWGPFCLAYAIIDAVQM